MKMTSCVACGCKHLNLGFIPDAGDQLTNVVMGWYAGEPKDVTFFGLKSGNVKSDSQREPIVAFKCSECGFLHLFAK